MWLALEEAEKARDKGEVPVGAVMIDSHGDVIARAHNTVETTNDPTNHAEMLCLRKASKSQESWRLLDTTLFVTLEPCPMCVGALLQSRVGRVVWGAPNKQLGADGSWISLLRGSGETKHPYHLSVQVSRNVLEEECSLLLKEFFRRRRAENDNAGSSDVPR
ncbi:cytidine/deoxycytidylate deaminase [Chloropicon primus]|uniref:tRNA(adenine(34)) deaminase n=1 Tax=Chloropicon primus TaxID=1764295 RepID=A0A5B8MRG4_9CHLO|nr:cytidine/deoxycytidylate deaminase [Chloropicon primus]UPR02257.1 cytidine/deoxycytidylate deaminase [Chloropicon primus]|eukprot:QDZ23043.1 cytidine/deoxycytidylate deaminase [Chloropicon primus]